MAKGKDKYNRFTVDQIDLTDADPKETNYRIVKAMLDANKRGESIHIAEFMDAVEGFCGEYENQYPRQSPNYEVGMTKKLCLIRTHATFNFVAPPRIKDQDKVEWGWESMYKLSKRLEEVTGGDIKLEIEYPFQLRQKFTS